VISHTVCRQIPNPFENLYGTYAFVLWRDNIGTYITAKNNILIIWSINDTILLKCYVRRSYIFFFFFDGAAARRGPWPPLQYASKPLDPLLCPSIRLFPSLSGPWTRHPAISFLVFLFVLSHTAFRTSFSEMCCLAFLLYDQAIVLFGIL
jgi:hypothetical protein